MDRERPGETAHENPGLGDRIVARYGRSPGVIPMEAMLQRFRRTGLFGHDRLPLLTRLSRRWGGINPSYPGSGGPLTFLQPSPHASTGLAGTERIGRSTESVSTRTVALGAPLGVPDTPDGPLPIARKAGKRMTSKEASTPVAPMETKPASAIVRRRRSRPEALSPDSGNETPIDSRTLGLLPLSPTDAGLGRAIIRRRKHPSPEASTRTTAPVTTETGPPVRTSPQIRKEESTIGRTALTLPVADEPPPSTRVSAQTFPALAPRSTSLDPPTGTANAIPPGSARRESSSPIETPDAAASRGDLGTAIGLRYARTTIATTAAPLPVSAALQRRSGPSRVDRSAQNVRALAENPPDARPTTAGTAMTTLPPTMAHRLPQPQAATVQSRAEQSFRGRAPGGGSRPADRLPAATPPAHPAIFRALMDNTRPSPMEPGAGIGFTDALSPARSPMPLAVQGQGRRLSGGVLQRERLPTNTWQTGDTGRSPSEISASPMSTGQGSGTMAAVRVEDLGVRSEIERNPPRAGDGERPNVDDLVDKVLRKLMRRLAVEQERRGWRRWF